MRHLLVCLYPNYNFISLPGHGNQRDVSSKNSEGCGRRGHSWDKGTGGHHRVHQAGADSKSGVVVDRVFVFSPPWSTENLRRGFNQSWEKNLIWHSVTKSCITWHSWLNHNTFVIWTNLRCSSLRILQIGWPHLRTSSAWPKASPLQQPKQWPRATRLSKKTWSPLPTWAAKPSLKCWFHARCKSTHCSARTGEPGPVRADRMLESLVGPSVESVERDSAPV